MGGGKTREIAGEEIFGGDRAAVLVATTAAVQLNLHVGLRSGQRVGVHRINGSGIDNG